MKYAARSAGRGSTADDNATTDRTVRTGTKQPAPVETHRAAPDAVRCDPLSNGTQLGPRIGVQKGPPSDLGTGLSR